MKKALSVEPISVDDIKELKARFDNLKEHL